MDAFDKTLLGSVGSGLTFLLLLMHLKLEDIAKTQQQMLLALQHRHEHAEPFTGETLAPNGTGSLFSEPAVFSVKSGDSQ